MFAQEGYTVQFSVTVSHITSFGRRIPEEKRWFGTVLRKFLDPFGALRVGLARCSHLYISQPFSPLTPEQMRFDRQSARRMLSLATLLGWWASTGRLRRPVSEMSSMLRYVLRNLLQLRLPPLKMLLDVMMKQPQVHI